MQVLGTHGRTRMCLSSGADSHWSSTTYLGRISFAAGNGLYTRPAECGEAAADRSSYLNAIACMEFRHVKDERQSRQRHEGWDIGLLLDRNRIAEESTGQLHWVPFVVQVPSYKLAWIHALSLARLFNSKQSPVTLRNALVPLTPAASGSSATMPGKETA